MGNKEMLNKSHLGRFSHIHAYSGIFRHFQTYPDIIGHIQGISGVVQAYSEPCVTLSYAELWYIQNPDILKTRGMFRILAYPKLWHIQNQMHIIQNHGILRTGGILRTLSMIFLMQV